MRVARTHEPTAHHCFQPGGIPAAELNSSAADEMAATVKAALKNQNGMWFGWSGKMTDQPASEPDSVEQSDPCPDRPVEERSVQEYCNGLANSVLWPILHCRVDLQQYSRADASGYMRVNHPYADQLSALINEDDVVWLATSLVSFSRASCARGAIATGLAFVRRPTSYRSFTWHWVLPEPGFEPFCQDSRIAAHGSALLPQAAGNATNLLYIAPDRSFLLLSLVRDTGGTPSLRNTTGMARRILICRSRNSHRASQARCAQETLHHTHRTRHPARLSQEIRSAAWSLSSKPTGKAARGCNASRSPMTTRRATAPRSWTFWEAAEDRPQARARR